MSAPRPARGLPDRPQYAGADVVLSDLDPAADAEVLHAATHGVAGADAVWRWMAYGPFDDAAAMRRWLEDCARSADPRFLAVRPAARPAEPVGMAAFLAVRPEHGSLEIGHVWYAPAAQRGRANTAAVRLMLGEAFDRLGYRRVEWKCDAGNARSRAAARRLGFRFEGLFRQHLIVKGKNRDTAWYALLDEDWPEVRARLDAWLAGELPGGLGAANGDRVRPFVRDDRPPAADQGS